MRAGSLSCFFVGLVHAMLIWSGDVLLVYALVGFALLAAAPPRRPRPLALIAACLLFPALAEVAARRPWSAAASRPSRRSSTSSSRRRTTSPSATARSLDAMRETARVFNWSWRSPFGLFTYASFFVQMATGILVGFVVGRRGWPRRCRSPSEAAERRACARRFSSRSACGADRHLVVAVRLGRRGRPSSSSALGADDRPRRARGVLRARRGAHRPRLDRELPRWLRPLRDAGRMPLSNYLLQTALASFVFYGWGLGFWNSAGPAAEIAARDRPLRRRSSCRSASCWLERFRYGPLEYLWRRFTYGSAPR